jgi:hypothetical protein
MKEQIKTAPPENISAEISPAPEATQTPRPLPFGVYTGSGKPSADAASENRKPQT